MHTASPFSSFPAVPPPPDPLDFRLAHRQQLETLGVLASGAAHDLNNLLTGIIGHIEAAEAMLGRQHPANAELARADAALSRAVALTRQMLNFGRESEAQATIDFVTTIQEALPLLRASLPRRAEFRAQFDLPSGFVHLNPNHLQQILFNLGINAGQALGQEPGTIRIVVSRVPAGEPPRVDVGALEPGPHLCLTVADTGSGMDAGTRARIFEAFFTTKPRGVGTGLGLSTVRNIVLSHAGGIAVRSVPGEGTVFRVYLPEQPAPVAPAANLDTPRDPDRAVHIAIVDDEETVVRLARQALEFSGYKTTALSTPEDCLAHVTADPEAFDLIITDQRMPAMTGIELVQALRARGAHVPVLITSGSIAAVTLREIQDVAPAQFIAKPFTLVDLLAAVESLLLARVG